ncbi:MAG: phenylpyruvate tautomerase MIF-related protein [Verrucomicrobiales bacterium]|nr:phenylpyruvate tautomerase MIF-related protein [Verrucomicrobiales bacterium]
MPLIKIKTNVILPPRVLTELLADSTAIASRELGKPESIFMTSAETEVAMMFGAEVVPTALFEIEVLDYEKKLSQSFVDEMTDLSKRLLDVPPENVFLKLTNVPRGSWAGGGKIY